MRRKTLGNRIVKKAITWAMVVMMAMVMTRGTKIPETLSAILAIGAFDVEASSTILMIVESVVSSPTLLALQVRKLEVLMVPL